MSIVTLLLHALLLSVAVSIDLMICGVAYGINKTETPFGKIMLVNLINSALFGVSLFFGYILGQYIPIIVTVISSITILCLLGSFKISQSVLKKNGISETEKNRTFNFREALFLGVGVAFDAMAGGFAAGVSSGNSVLFCLIVFGISLITDVILFYVGKFIGFKISNKSIIDLNWLGGVILIGLGVSKFF